MALAAFLLSPAGMLRMLTAALTLLVGCATTTSVHRPPTVPEATEINEAAVRAGSLEVTYDPPAGGAPVVPLTTELDGGYLASADTHDLTVKPASGPPLVIPLGRVHSVTTVNHWQGIGPGLVGGALAAFVGVIAVALSTPPPTGECESVCGRSLGLSALITVVAIPVGGIIGAAIGRRQTFTLGGDHSLRPSSDSVFFGTP